MRIGVRSLAAAIAAVLVSAAALADSSALDEVVVTAQRKVESAQSVGIALSVLAGDSLKSLGVSNVNDLQNTTPSLEVEPAFGSGQAQFRLRGVGFIDYTANNSSPVGVNIDQVPLPFPVQTQGQLFDIERVEVLRGPQGTLYGRNTTGGAVNFIANRPTDDYHAGISARYGSHDLFDAEGFVSGPLADSLKGRISWAVTEGGAWQRNRVTGEKLGKQNKYAGRLQLQWDPGQNVSLLLNIHAAQDKSDTNGLQFFRDYNPGAGRPVIAADSSPYLTGWSLQPGFASTVGISPNSRPSLNNSNNGVDLTATFQFDGAALTSITAYNKLIRREYGDWDGSQYAASDVFFRDNIKVFSQEVRLASTGSGAFGWVGGVYYSNEKFAEDFFSDFNESPLVGGTAHTSSTQNGKSLGVFGQTEYKFVDRWKAILGLRYEHESRDLNDLNTSFEIPGVITIPTFTGLQNRSLSNSDVSGRVGLEYRAADRTLFYATISRGVKSGGYNIHNTTSVLGVGPFKPEKLLSYEMGVKSDVTASLRLNASIFYYDYKDQQVLSKTLDPVSGSYIGVFVNAPSEIHGGELEATWRPVAGLQIEQYLGYKEGKFKGDIYNSDKNDPTAQNFNGHPIDFPKFSYGGQVSYEARAGSLKVTPSINYDFHDTYKQLFLLGPNYTVDSYWLANANLSIAPAEGKSWSAGVWVHNVFGTKYDVTKNFFLPGSFVALAGQPTTIGIQASYAF